MSKTLQTHPFLWSVISKGETKLLPDPRQVTLLVESHVTPPFDVIRSRRCVESAHLACKGGAKVAEIPVQTSENELNRV